MGGAGRLDDVVDPRRVEPSIGEHGRPGVEEAAQGAPAASAQLPTLYRTIGTPIRRPHPGTVPASHVDGSVEETDGRVTFLALAIRSAP